MALCLQFITGVAIAYKEGGGGDPVEQEFFALGKTAVERAKTSTLLTEVQKTRLVGLFDKAILQATDEQLVNKRKMTKTAINIPEKNLIFINRSLWNRVSNPELKQGIALHEYFGLAGIETDEYKVSADVLRLSEQLLNKFAVADGPLLEGGVYNDSGNGCLIRVVQNNKDNLHLTSYRDPIHSGGLIAGTHASPARTTNEAHCGDLTFVEFKCDGNICQGKKGLNYYLEISQDRKQLLLHEWYKYKTRLLKRPKTSSYSVSRYTFSSDLEQKKTYKDMIDLLSLGISVVENLRTQAINTCMWDAELRSRTNVLNYKRTFFEGNCVYQLGYDASATVEANTSHYNGTRVSFLLKSVFSMSGDTLADKLSGNRSIKGFKQIFSDLLTIEGVSFGSFVLNWNKPVIIDDIEMRALTAAEFMSQLDAYKTNFELAKKLYEEKLMN